MPHPVVETRLGAIEGRFHDSTMVFRGIPYGTDTGGAGRLRHAGTATVQPRVATEIGPRR